MNRQASFNIQFERGEDGLRALAPHAAVIVIVDVLSFSTAVDVAVGRGATVLPYRYADATAKGIARRQNAYLAVPRDERSADHPYSLSPSTLVALPRKSRLVLPSPNGSTLVAIATSIAPTTSILVGCLRNASAIAAFVQRYSTEEPIAVIAAGERWPNGTLRPALEDDLGAGAIITALPGRSATPEARYVAGAFAQCRHRLEIEVRNCTTGIELLDAGYPQDVETACEMDVSRAVPLLGPGGLLMDAESLSAGRLVRLSGPAKKWARPF
jgi:2-phosphosulfolactate phosphatase